MAREADAPAQAIREAHKAGMAAAAGYLEAQESPAQGAALGALEAASAAAAGWLEAQGWPREAARIRERLAAGEEALPGFGQPPA